MSPSPRRCRRSARTACLIRPAVPVVRSLCPRHGRGQSGRWMVLSSHEQQVWDDVQRFWDEEAEEPPRPAPSRRQGASREEADLPAAVVAGTWITITLVLLGAMVAGLAVGVATAL